MTTAPCSACGAGDGRWTHATVEATYGSIAVLGERVPVVVCTCGRPRVPEGFDDAARQAWVDALPVARARVLRPDACASCATSMSMPVRRTDRAVTVSPPDLAVMTLRFDLPMQRCSECGLDQVPSRSHDDLDRAIDALLRAAAEATSGS